MRLSTRIKGRVASEQEWGLGSEVQGLEFRV